MIDRKNVIKGLEYCTGNLSCIKCPYHEEEYCCKTLKHDALELLKAQQKLIDESHKGEQTMELSIDRKKIIKGLSQHCEESMFDRCGECPYYEVEDKPFNCRDAILMDVLTLLKEQPEIVRCKNCKFWLDTIKCPLCSEGMLTDGNWFCADGERR